MAARFRLVLNDVEVTIPNSITGNTRIVDALNSNIYKQFIANKIEMPYSKHDTYIKEMPSAD